MVSEGSKKRLKEEGEKKKHSQNLVSFLIFHLYFSKSLLIHIIFATSSFRNTMKQMFLYLANEIMMVRPDSHQPLRYIILFLSYIFWRLSYFIPHHIATFKL